MLNLFEFLGSGLNVSMNLHTKVFYGWYYLKFISLRLYSAFGRALDEASGIDKRIEVLCPPRNVLKGILLHMYQ